MARKRTKWGRAWKMERASVRRQNRSRPRSNKYRPEADLGARPAPGSREFYWRGGYRRRDGTYVRGHYVKNPHYKAT